LTVSTPWQTATVLSVREETPTAKTFRLALEAPVGHRAGQHFVVRLTAPDGYTASRSYSVASAPDGGSEFELTVERLADGEVSMFLHDVVEPGDDLEVRGPIGGYFVWEATSPALLIGGGSGVVPLMAMLRLARARGYADAKLVVSVRTPDDLYYREELVGRTDATAVYTRSAPPDTPRAPGHVSADDLRPLLRDDAGVFVCGSAPFTDAVGDLLVELGVAPERIRFERFGPSA
jgi:ferredoxin-NADP reductase